MSRLIVCFDGTWNTPDKADCATNVVKILRAISSDDGAMRQIVSYNRGVGTGDFLDRIVGGASGKGLTRNMVDGYRFLANNYREGDELYIFGFSRGAYTARALAGLISFAGLLNPVCLGRDLSAVFELYRSSDLSKQERNNALAKLDGTINRAFPVPIECVGVWDTVGSLGIPGDLGRRLTRRKYYFHDVQLSPQVRVALHAIGIDEKRASFPPTLWVSEKNAAPPPGQIVEQVWFAGVHSNIGGSYTDARLSDIALDWMIKRVRKHTGLRFDDGFAQSIIDPNPILGRGIESRSAMYLGSKAYPYQRLIMQQIPEGKGFGEWFRRTFEKLDRRSIVPEDSTVLGERIHISALKRWGQRVEHDCKDNGDPCKKREYVPANLEAVLRKAVGSGAVPVCDNDGEVMDPEAVPWPTFR